MARDLHDGVAQELAFIASQTQWSSSSPTTRRQLGQIMDSVERALDESRGAIAALSRPMDEPLDLAIGHAALDIANRIGARLQLDLEEGVEVPSHWRDALLRITREAVSNAVRHGRARTVSTRDARRRCGVAAGHRRRRRLRPRRAALEPELRAHQHARAGRVAGRQFSVASSPGAGTTIEVTLP